MVARNEVNEPVLWDSLLSESGVAEKSLYDPSEAALILGVSKSTVKRWVKVGELRAHRFGPRRVVFLYNTLREWVDKMEKGSIDAG